MPKTATRKSRTKPRARSPRPIHKKIILHPITIFFMLCVGVFLASMTFRASADNIQATARVAGEPPAEPAVIVSPVNGDVFTVSPITVSGTCPDSTYVSIYRNNIFAGTDFCSGDNQFSLEVDLVEGNNSLLARVFNYADVEGPASDPVEVTFSPPAPPPEPGPGPAPGPRTGGSPSSKPEPSVQVDDYFIYSEYKFKGVDVGDRINIKIIPIGGLPPYSYYIKWGDGKEDKFVRSNRVAFRLSHIYTTVGDDNGKFTVKISGDDASGQKAFLQLFVIVRDPTANYITIATGGRLDGGVPQSWLKILWPAYAMVMLMTFSFWLGEKEILMFHGRSPRKRQVLRHRH